MCTLRKTLSTNLTIERLFSCMCSHVISESCRVAKLLWADFTTKLQNELNSSPQPCLVPFLRRSLPYLQQSLLNGELSIDGVNPPPRNSTNTPSVIRGVASTNAVQNRPQIIQRPPIIRTINPNTANATAAGMIRTLQTPKVITNASAVAGAGGIIQKQFVQGASGVNTNISSSL